jgi:hypothetical protein
MDNKWHLFLSRLTFLCNGMFVLCLLLRFTHLVLPEVLTGIILILGWFPVSPLLNLVTAVGTLYLWLNKKHSRAPAWLLTVNLFFLAFQFIYFILS